METSQPLQNNQTPTHQPLELQSTAFNPDKKEQQKRRFLRGMIWLGMGAFLLVTSFLVNFILFDSDISFVTPMYVMTILGSCGLLKGMAEILGF